MWGQQNQVRLSAQQRSLTPKAWRPDEALVPAWVGSAVCRRRATGYSKIGVVRDWAVWHEVSGPFICLLVWGDESMQVSVSYLPQCRIPWWRKAVYYKTTKQFLHSLSVFLYFIGSSSSVSADLLQYNCKHICSILIYTSKRCFDWKGRVSGFYCCHALVPRRSQAKQQSSCD